MIKKGRLHGHIYGKKPGDNFYLANQLKKKCKKRECQGIHDRFLFDHAFRVRLRTIETKKFVEDGMFLQMKITFVYQKKNTSTTRTNGSSISISRAMTPNHGENVLISKSVGYNRTFTPRSWRMTTQAHDLLEVSGTATVIAFFFHFVAMEWILVIFIRIQRKSMTEDACKDL